MERLRSLFWSSLMALALVGLLTGLAAPGVMAGPAVKITAPGEGDVVSGQVLITVAYRSDSDQPIARLEILVDRKLVREWNLAAPRLEGVQSFTWDFSFAASTSHTIGARAIDAAGETGAATITVTVAGPGRPSSLDRVPPVINIYYPAQGARVSGEVEVRAEATDNVGVKYVSFFIDGKLHKMSMNAPPWVDLWDTARASDGPHVLQAKAMDAAENAATSAEVTVLAENHAMTTTPRELMLPQASVRAETTTLEPVPQIVQPKEMAAPEAGVKRMSFGSQPQMVGSRSRQVQRAESAALLSGIGYVPAINEAREQVRTSMPGTVLAALSDQQRLTVPRGLTEGPAETPTAARAERGTTGPMSPEIGAVEAAPRLSTPRASMAEPTTTGVPEGGEGAWMRLRPILQVTPAAESDLAGRSTCPQMLAAANVSSRPSARVSLEVPELGIAALAEAETMVVHSPLSGESGKLLARLDQRMTTPELLAGVSEALAVKKSEAQAVRVAVLPIQVGHAGIPADGRLSTPTGAKLAPVATMEFEQVQMLFDNEALQLRAQPEMREGISIAPLREIFEHTDGVLYWFPIEKRVRAVNAENDIRLQIGDPAVQVNQATRVLEVTPYIKRGRTMVPLQFIADTLDVSITFNPDSGQICITTNKF